MVPAVETEANRDSRSTVHMKGVPSPSLVGSLGSLCRYRRHLSCLCCSIRPSTQYFFLTVHYFTSLVPIALQDWQAVIPRRLSLNMCLCYGTACFLTYCCHKFIKRHKRIESTYLPLQLRDIQLLLILFRSFNRIQFDSHFHYS